MSRLKVEYQGGRKFQVTSGANSFVIDLPKEKGGGGEGPNSTDVFISSLGSCVGVYIVFYCEKVGIDCSGMVIDIDYKMADNPRRVGEVDVKVSMSNAELGARKDAVLRTAQMCAVKNTFLNPPKIDIAIESKG